MDEALKEDETPILVGRRPPPLASEVISGGSCLYLDWLVNGEPDTAASACLPRGLPIFSQDPAVQARIAAQLQVYQDAMDWDGAIGLLAAIDEEKAARINRNNWPLASGPFQKALSLGAGC